MKSHLVLIPLMYIITWLFFKSFLFFVIALPILYAIYFYRDKSLTLGNRVIICIYISVISFISFTYTQFSSITDYEPKSLSDGLGYALMYIFVLLVSNLGIPVLLIIITIVQGLIKFIKSKKKEEHQP